MPTKDEIVTSLFRLPLSEHISYIDTERHKDAVRFTWRGDTFKISTDFLVMVQVEDGILSRDNEAILIEALIKRAYVDREMKKERKDVQE